MVERFRNGDIVRICTHGSDGTVEPTASREAVFDGYVGPSQDSTGWEVAVTVRDASRRSGYSTELFDEMCIRSTGFRFDYVEQRVVIGVRPTVVIADRVLLRLITSLTTTDERAVAMLEQGVRAGLSEIVPDTHIWTANRHAHDDPSMEVELHVEMCAEDRGLETFEAICAMSSTGWSARYDDGWRCEDQWSRFPGVIFLSPEVLWAQVVLTPWSTALFRHLADGA